MSIIAIDFETANELPSSPCSMGLAWIDCGKVVRQEYRLIRPKQMRFGVYESRVHGLGPSDVEGAPEFPEVVSEFLSDIDGGWLVAHNAQFDVDVLCSTLSLYGLAVPRFSFACSLTIARRVWRQESSFGLADLCRRIGFSFQNHHAGEDAVACAQVLLASMSSAGATDLPELLARLGIQAGIVDEIGVVSCKEIALPMGGPRRLTDYVRRLTEYPGPPDQCLGSRLRFLMKGSSGNYYNIEEVDLDDGVGLKCECMGWKTRRRCKHIQALLYGDVTYLASGNECDVERLRCKIDLTGGIPSLYSEWCPPSERPVRLCSSESRRVAAPARPKTTVPALAETLEYRSDTAIAGKTVLFTGSLENFTRGEAKAKAGLLGAKVTTLVSDALDFVIAGKDAGWKVDKARDLGVTVLTEDEWLALIGG